MDQFHAAFPKQPAIGTEEASTLSTRGIYENDSDRGYVAAYDSNAPRWGSTAERWWNVLRAARLGGGGLRLDGIRLSRRADSVRVAVHQLAFRRARHVRVSEGQLSTTTRPGGRSDKPVLHVLPHWNWAGKEGQPISVWVYSEFRRGGAVVERRESGAKDDDAEFASGVERAITRRECCWRVDTTARGVAMEVKNETTGAASAIRSWRMRRRSTRMARMLRW